MKNKDNVYIPLTSPDLNGNELKYLIDAFSSSWISSKGYYIDKFEEKFSKYCECKYGIAVSNGTAALHLALTALGIGSNDEVIVPDLSFVATINAVLYSRATPVVVDIEKDGWCIDPKEIEKVITPSTKAIIAVHLYGQPCDMATIIKIAKKHNIFVIEDCAEAHGAKFNHRKVGSFGDVGCFSFFGNKVITTGEGGMCVTNSKKMDSKIRILRNHGMSKTKKYWHRIVGYNYRMTNLQAAIGVAQLEKIDHIQNFRKGIENEYKKNFSHFEFLEFQRDNLPNREKITWLVSVLMKNNRRDECLKKLRAKGIDARPFFYPFSEMYLYKKYIFSSRISRKISKQGMILPTGNNLDKSVFNKISRVLDKYE